jgi:hypothetical protein
MLYSAKGNREGRAAHALSELDTVEPEGHRPLPHLGVPVVISFGQTWGPGRQDGRAEKHSTFAAGLTETWVVVESTSRARSVQVNLTPIGARLVLGLPMSELTNRSVELRDVLGPMATHLTERLQQAPSWEPRFDILDHSASLDGWPAVASLRCP